MKNKKRIGPETAGTPCGNCLILNIERDDCDPLEDGFHPGSVAMCLIVLLICLLNRPLYPFCKVKAVAFSFHHFQIV